MDSEHIPHQNGTKINIEGIVPQDISQVTSKDILSQGEAETDIDDMSYMDRIHENFEDVLPQDDTQRDSRDIMEGKVFRI